MYLCRFKFKETEIKYHTKQLREVKITWKRFGEGHSSIIPRAFVPLAKLMIPRHQSNITRINPIVP